MQHRNHIPIWLIAGLFMLALSFASRPTNVQAQDSGVVQDGAQNHDQILEIEQGSIAVVNIPSPLSVPEPGGIVTFTVAIKNLDPENGSVTITSLVDNVYGDLNDQENCTIPQDISTNAYTCTFTGSVSGNGGETKTSTITALGHDENGNPISARGSAIVTINDLTPAIQLINSVSPRKVTEPGGLVTFSADIMNPATNIDPITVMTVTDTIYGDINDQGDCSFPQVLVPGRGYSCQFQKIVEGNGGDSQINVMTVEATDDEGNLITDSAEAIVHVGDADPRVSVLKSVSPSTLLEPGGDATFTIIVKNESLNTDPITLTRLVDDEHGDLNGLGGCDVPQLLLPGQSYNCKFSTSIDGNVNSGALASNTYSVTAQAMDDEGNSKSGSDDAVIEIIDRMPEITLSQHITPSIAAEAGTDVTFSVVITNMSFANTDPITLITLTHNIYGNLQNECDLSQMISYNANYNCSFTRLITGNVGEMKINIITAEGMDDEGNVVRDQDDATVTIADSDSTILLIKKVDANGDGTFSSSETVPEPGGKVKYQIEVHNDSAIDDVTINSINDSILGDISANCDSGLPALLQPNESITCTFSHDIQRNAGDVIDSIATAIGQDEDGKLLSATDGAKVIFTDQMPALNVTNSVNPMTVTEVGDAVQFTITIENASVASDPVMLESLVDDLYGDLSDYRDRDDLKGCAVPHLLNSGDTYRCTFIIEGVAGNANPQLDNQEASVVTVIGTDDENNQARGQADAAILYKNAAPIVDVIQRASPINVPEPGGIVNFTVFIQNNSNEFDPITINHLEGPDYDKLQEHNCRVPQKIDPGEQYSCTFTRDVEGFPGDKHTSLVAVSGEDDEGTPINETNAITVTVSDIAPTIVVVKSADIPFVSSEGADVTFSVAITNVSMGRDEVIIDKLFDTTYGDLNGWGTCELPQTLGPSDTEDNDYHCTFSVNIAGNVGDTKTSVVIAEGHGDRGKFVSDGDDETVSVTNIQPFLVVTSLVDTATPFGGDGVYNQNEIVPEPGGPVDHRIEVENISQMDITILDVKTLNPTDQESVDISEHCIPTPPTLLSAGQKVICKLDKAIEGDAGESDLYVVSATGLNSAGHGLTDFADSTVVIGNQPPAIKITNTPKPARVPESGGLVAFTLVISNTSPANTISDTDPVNIFSLQDSISGNLHGRGDCSIPQTLLKGESYSCTYKIRVAGNVNTSQNHVSIAAATDNEGNQAIDFVEATVDFDDVLPEITLSTDASPNSVDEPGDDASITVVIKNDNNQFDPMVLLRLVDEFHGNLTNRGDCVLPQIIEPGHEYACAFTIPVYGDAGHSENDTITGQAQDDEKNSVQENRSETITVGDVDPIFTVTQRANPNAVLEPGENVSFTVTIHNGSVKTDPVTITSLVDDIHGNLYEQGYCSMPEVLESTQDYTCTFTAFVGGNATYTETNTVAAKVEDNEDNTVEAQGSTTVTLRNAPPALRVTKEPDVHIVPESGGDVTFTIEVSNESTSNDPVTLTGLNDNIYGNLNGQGTCEAPHTIQPNESYVCTFTVQLEGNAGESETAIVTATGVDDEGHVIIAEGSTTVVIGNVGSLLQVTKQVDADGDGTFSDGENVLAPGGTAAYRIVIQNNSTVDEITLDTVDDPPLGGDISDSCLPSLPATLIPGDEVLCTVTEEIRGVAGDHLVNVVTVTGTDDEGNPLRDTADANVTIVQPKADLALVAELLGDVIVMPIIDPDMLTAQYRLRYVNLGPDPASDVRLIDILPAGMVIDQAPSLPFDGINLPQLTWALGTVQPGASGEITVAVRLDKATQGDVLTNVASISCGCTDPDSSNDEGSVNFTVPQTIVGQDSPTAIALQSFQIDVIEDNIKVSWTTLAEHNTRGFELYRSTSDNLNGAVLITPDMILSKGASGGDYQFLDQSSLTGVTYIYWLLETELNGVRNDYGPVQEFITVKRLNTPPLSLDFNNTYLPVIMR